MHIIEPIVSRPFHIIATVINDLNYDQRMQRICQSLAKAGYTVTLIGRELNSSTSLKEKSYIQKRFRCIFNKGKFFYLEYNIRLFFYLLFHPFDLVWSVDMDTLLPGFWVSSLKMKYCVYDAHEYFSEVPELEELPFEKWVWKKLENWMIPKLDYACTVSDSLAQEFYKKHKKKFILLRNLPMGIREIQNSGNEKIILYQGALNKGRALFDLILAFKIIPAKLLLAGEGDITLELKELVKTNHLENKVSFTGRMAPEELFKLTQNAFLGINLLDGNGLNNYYSLANKFFDYLQAGIPSLCNDYPEYKMINNELEVSVLLKEVTPESIAGAINQLLMNDTLYSHLKTNCNVLRDNYVWEKEEGKLLEWVFRIRNR